MYSNQRRYSLIKQTIGLLDILYSIIVVVIASSALSTLVTCRSYNNGLVFYDLHTHGTYLPPTVSVSRGRSLANFQYSDKGSIWSTFGQPCECANKLCGCCAGLQVEQYKFDQKICANVTFVPDAEEAQLEVYLNEKSSAKYGLSARNPSPFCIPVMMGVPMGMCVQMSNIQMVGNNLNMCMDFVVRLASTDLFEMHFQCMRMGQDGLQYLDKNGQPVLPESSRDDDYDFFDENSSPLDADGNGDEEAASSAEYYEELEKQQQQQQQQQKKYEAQNQKELIEQQKKKNEKHEEEVKEQEDQLFQIKSPLSEEIASQLNAQNESEMINASTINVNNANNLDHGYGYNDDHDDKVNDDNKVIVAINDAPTIALSNHEDSNIIDNNDNDEQSDNNLKQNELITTIATATTKAKTPTTTTTTIRTTTTDQLNDPIIDEEMPNYSIAATTDKRQQSAAAATTVNSSTADLDRDIDSMAHDEVVTEKEDNNSDTDNDDNDDEDENDEKTTSTASATDATEENSSNEINTDDEGNEDKEEVDDDEEDEEEGKEEEEHENNDLDDQMDMIINESVTSSSNDNNILNDVNANANMANERVNVTANEHKVGIDDLNNELNNGNKDDHNDDDDDDGAENNDVHNDDDDGGDEDDDEDDGDGLYNDNSNVDADANNDDDDDSHQNSLNDIENTLKLPQLRSLSSNKFYRYIHRF